MLKKQVSETKRRGRKTRRERNAHLGSVQDPVVSPLGSSSLESKSVRSGGRLGKSKASELNRSKNKRSVRVAPDREKEGGGGEGTNLVLRELRKVGILDVLRTVVSEDGVDLHRSEGREASDRGKQNDGRGRGGSSLLFLEQKLTRVLWTSAMTETLGSTLASSAKHRRRAMGKKKQQEREKTEVSFLSLLWHSVGRKREGQDENERAYLRWR